MPHASPKEKKNRKRRGVRGLVIILKLISG
jgi:hypothetical protein